jgi:hypothetical protein
MKAELRIRHPVLIGAITVGVGIALAQLTIMGYQGRVAVIPLLVLVSLGALTGAVWGAVVKMMGRAGYVIGAIVSIIPAGLLAVAGLTWYAITPWSAPLPYPGSEVEVDGGTGSWGHFRNQTYTVSLPLEEVERYYLEQMAEYCAEQPEIAVPEDCEGYAICRSVSCDIRRLWAEQRFEVRLYEVSESETEVSQWDAWED